jgi:PAS domain S-box-containing protein
LHCIYTHDLEGNFLEANDAALKILGYSREELLSLNFSALIVEDKLALAMKTGDEIMRTGFQQEFTEYQLKRKDGSFVWVETDGSLINKNGNPYAILGVARDITARKKTEKEKDRGTGLGLASAYGIIKNHDGIITVESTKGQGAAFSVYLPASDKDIIEEKQSEQEILTGSETVLLVDDEELILDVGVQMLKKMGYRVLTASHGDQAIEIYRRNKEPIAIVILDLVMPQISGGEIYDRLKAIDSNVKVLLSSGYSVNGQATEILNRGCDGFIQKPFRLDELSKKIRTILTP